MNNIIAIITTVQRKNVSNIDVAASNSTEPLTNKSQRIAAMTWLFGTTRKIIELSSRNVSTKI